MSAGNDGAVSVAVDELEDDRIVQLDGARVPDLERAVLTAAIDLKAVRLILWAFHASGDGEEFSSRECREVWRWLINYSAGHHLVPSREDVLQAFPGFRFVKARFSLLPMAEKLFKRPRKFDLNAFARLQRRSIFEVLPPGRRGGGPRRG